MTRYIAKLVDGRNLDEVVDEMGCCGASDFVPSDDETSIRFVADVDDLPSIQALRGIGDVQEEPADDDRGIYVGLKRSKVG